MLSNITLLIFLIIFIIGESSLLIYKSINGTNYPIASFVKVINGRNLTLKCKDINNANNEVEWSRKSDDLGFQTKYILNDDFSRINFIPITPEDADVYTCKSLKYNVSKAITITVERNVTNRRLKRTQYRFGEENDLDKLNFQSLNVPDPVGDFFKNIKMKIKSTPPPLWIDNKYINIIHDRSEVWPGYGRPGSNMFTSNIASNNMPSHVELEYEELLRKTDSKIVDSTNSISGNNEYGFLYGIAIIGGLFLFGGIMCMCVRNNPNIRARLDRSASDNPACTHAMCVRHRDTNPLAGCILTNINPTNHIPTPIVHTDDSGDVTVLTFPDETIDDSIDYRVTNDEIDENLDVPPSYANSVDITKCDLPPSYEEVLKTMLPPTYSNDHSPGPP